MNLSKFFRVNMYLEIFDFIFFFHSLLFLFLPRSHKNEFFIEMKNHYLKKLENPDFSGSILINFLSNIFFLLSLKNSKFCFIKN